MSKIGQYFLEQIEAGNFEVDARGIYHVKQPNPLQNRKECATPRNLTTGNASGSTGSGRSIQGDPEGTVRQSDDPSAGSPVSEEKSSDPAVSPKD